MSNVVKLADVRKQRRGKPAHPADDLSFMKLRKPRGSGIDYWAVEASGDYSADCDKGNELGREYLAYLGQHPTVWNASLLNCIVHDMVSQRAGGRLTGIEIGFLSRVNEYAMATAAALVEREARA